MSESPGLPFYLTKVPIETGERLKQLRAAGHDLTLEHIWEISADWRYVIEWRTGERDPAVWPGPGVDDREIAYAKGEGSTVPDAIENALRAYDNHPKRKQVKSE